MNPLTAWNLKARAHKCHMTGVAFQPGEIFYTAIYFHQDGKDWERHDYSEAAWEQLKDTLRPHSQWRAPYHPPEGVTKEKAALVKIGTEELLRHLMEEDHPATEGARYVLALMLERKKALRQKHVERRDDGAALIYEHVKSGEVFLIRDPGLHLEDMDRVGAEVATLLEQAENALRERQEREAQEAEALAVQSEEPETSEIDAEPDVAAEEVTVEENPA